MIEIADIFRLHGPQYLAKFGHRILPSHRRVMREIMRCRTEALGGQLYLCDHCTTFHYSFHSCKNRHCPKCQNDQAELWLKKQESFLLPIQHFMVTFTIPEELRSVARSNQRLIYDLLFRASADALLELAADPRFVGGKIGMVGVLHTWTRDLLYHPHVHYIATGRGLSPDGQWLKSRRDFLVHVRPLSILFRAKFRDLLARTDLFQSIPAEVWDKDWVVHCQPVGSGHAAFKYLAPYIFRVAIGNKRIIKLENGFVTFSYKESATDRIKFATVSAEEFIRRFLQHVLPDHFVKVRYYGLLSPSNRRLIAQARKTLRAGNAARYNFSSDSTAKSQPVVCPACGSALKLIQRLKPQRPP
jgi:hypothetical protein